MPEINYWTQLSIDFANQRNYLDELFRVYPTIPDFIRDLDQSLWSKIENSFNEKNDSELIKSLLKLDLFPIKDSYIAYLKRDKTSIDRNPNTISRLSGRLYEMGLDKIWDRSSEPKETNRQIGPMFRNWYRKGSLGMKMTQNGDEFINSNENIILDLSDAGLKDFAKKYIGYVADKGLDLVCKVNGKTVFAEAKFLTDFGGHQNAQFNDAINLVKINNSNPNIITIAILDGVLFIKPTRIGGGNKMYRSLVELSNNHNIISSLVLRDFLYQL